MNFKEIQNFLGFEIFFGLVNEKKAKRWFLKNYKKLKVHRTSPVFDSLLIEKNPDYKIWNFKKPFKGKNPKYIVLGINKENITLKLKK